MNPETQNKIDETMKTKHTPGPWKHHLGRGANPLFHVQTSGGYQVARVAAGSDARLIAAAPELLAALQTFCQLSYNLSVALTDEQISEATTALAPHATQAWFTIKSATGE